MTVSINGIELDLFLGAQVKNVLMAYSLERYQAALAGHAIVRDSDGHEVDLSGELSGGESFHIDEPKGKEQ